MNGEKKNYKQHAYIMVCYLNEKQNGLNGCWWGFRWSVMGKWDRFVYDFQVYYGNVSKKATIWTWLE